MILQAWHPVAKVSLLMDLTASYFPLSPSPPTTLTLGRSIVIFAPFIIVLFLLVVALHSVSGAFMASIPLHCNICPSEPTFSDTSHLLTHVASKGHLSHYFKCQVRSRQDENVRHKVDVYDYWYNKYQIEKLLSERMSAKQARPRAAAIPSTAKKLASTKTSIEKKERKPRAPRQSKKPSQDEGNVAGLKSTTVLDPQLDLVPSQNIGHGYESTHEMEPQAPITRMSDYPTETPERMHSSNIQPPRQRSANDLSKTPDPDDTDYEIFRTFIKSPTASAHRDPTELPISAQLLQAANDASAEEDTHAASPILKGIRYPGMSLFDAASRSAQRLRNQKKDNSIMDQLEVDAAAIEPMEHIYWPEGHLKKSRIITGNVESSPLKEETPSPTKFRRSNSGYVLAELSTNVPLYIGRRSRDTNSQEELGSRLDIMADTALKTLRSVFPEPRPISPTPMFHSDDGMEILGSPLRFHKEPTFSVYRDPPAADSLPPLPSACRNIEKLDASLPIRSSPHRSSPWRPLSSNLGPSPFDRSPVNPFGSSPITRGQRTSPKTILTPPSTEDKENYIFANGHRHMMELEESPQRITQRYFSVVGNNSPQYYTSMPPGMDFGGLCGRSFHGPSVNPLNAFQQKQYVQAEYLEAEQEPKTPQALTKAKRGKSVSFQDH